MQLPSLIQKVLTTYFRYVAIAVAVIVLGAGYGLVINSKVAAIQKLNVSDRVRAKNQLADDTAYVKAMEASLAAYRKAFSATDLKRLDRFLPPTSELPDIVLTMKNLVQSAGFDLQQLNVSTLTSAAGASTTTAAPTTPTTSGLSSSNQLVRYQSVPGLVAEDITMVITGQADYNGYKKFLSTLELSEPLLDVMNVSFTQPTGDTASVSSYNFSVRTYYLPIATPAATPTTTP